MNIRPVSDLRNHFTEIENSVSKGDPVFLTKNGYGTMVVMSLDQYSELENNVEMLLDQADRYAATHSERLSHSEVFSAVRKHLDEL